jgi:hypothetical protein
MMPTRFWAAASLIILAVLTAGCESTQKHGGNAPIAHGPTPPYATVAAAYNARVNRLERIACPGAIIFQGHNDKGEAIHEQLECNLQIALPASVALRMDKVSQTVFYLGSNPTHYWWFDLTGEKTGLFGKHDSATLERVSAFGLPVHPLDFLEVLAISPIPGPDSEQATHAKLVWSGDGRSLGLTLPGRWAGQRRFWLDPNTYEPSRVDLLDKAGKVVLTAQLSRFVEVEVSGDARVHPRMPSQLDVDVPSQNASAVITLPHPKNPGEAQKPKLFDLSALLQYYRIQKTIDLDQQRPAQQRAAANGN